MAEAESLRFKRLAHPPYSSDIAPSDFIRLGEVQRWPKGESDTSVDELDMANRSIHEPLPGKMLGRVLEDWAAGCRALPVSDGNCLDRK
jgi:hypothetical protein